MGRTKKHHGPAPATRMTARRLRPKQAIYYGNKKSPQGPTVLIEETKGPQRDTGTIQLGKGSSTNPEPKASARKRGRPTRTFAPRRGRPKSETNSQNVESSSQNITTPKRGRGRPKKEAEDESITLQPSESLDSVSRGRGRPRKGALPSQSTLENSKSSTAAPLRRGRGKPQKSVSSSIDTHNIVSTPRRGSLMQQRLRARKAPSKTTTTTTVARDTDQTKRGRGRPPKLKKELPHGKPSHGEHDTVTGSLDAGEEHALTWHRAATQPDTSVRAEVVILPNKPSSPTLDKNSQLADRIDETSSQEEPRGRSRVVKLLNETAHTVFDDMAPRRVPGRCYPVSKERKRKRDASPSSSEEEAPKDRKKAKKGRDKEKQYLSQELDSGSSHSSSDEEPPFNPSQKMQWSKREKESGRMHRDREDQEANAFIERTKWEKRQQARKESKEAARRPESKADGSVKDEERTASVNSTGSGAATTTLTTMRVNGFNGSKNQVTFLELVDQVRESSSNGRGHAEATIETSKEHDQAGPSNYTAATGNN